VDNLWIKVEYPVDNLWITHTFIVDNLWIISIVDNLCITQPPYW